MKKRTLIFILSFIFFSNILWSQNYKKVDSIVLTYPEKYSSASKLSKRIASDFTNDFEKVRAIYTWIINNVAYDPKESGKFIYEYSNKNEYEKKEEKFNNKLSNRVISKGKAVCQGYATLFKKICDELNIKSKYVTGSAKTKIKDIGKRYYSNHAWNIILIGKKEYLLDVTWGSGTYSNHFNKKANYFYFLTDPNLFIEEHYPDYYENSILNKKITKVDFLNKPLIYNYDFKLVNPKSGIIKKSELKLIKFTFSTEEEVSYISYQMGRKHNKIRDFLFDNNKLEFEIDISEFPKEKELILYFNHKAIIGFKIEK